MAWIDSIVVSRFILSGIASFGLELYEFIKGEVTNGLLLLILCVLVIIGVCTWLIVANQKQQRIMNG